jgi:hypothetical protein
MVRPMLLVPCSDGHIAVTQPAHGDMTGQIARAWGNKLAGTFEPWADVVLAAEEHDVVWEAWEQAPTLDPATGLPYAFDAMPAGEHLTIHSASLDQLAADSPYAALLVALHHASLAQRPSLLARLSRRGGNAAALVDTAEHLRGEVRSSFGASDEEVERNRRLLRTWDGISLHLLQGEIPRLRREVPMREEALDLALAREGDSFTVDPWPFREKAVAIRTEGRLIERTFGDVDEMRAALAAAPWIELAYELRPVNAPR